MNPEKAKRIFSDDTLEKESRLFTRYLLDSEPSQNMIDRYVSANRALVTETGISAGRKVVEYAVTHPWSIPYLDAAAGVLQPDSLLRKKIYIMAAVLEASPRFVSQFLPKSLTAVGLFAVLIVNGLVAGIKMIIGIPIFYFLRK
jgi:hypothetical protein